ncbi:MAG: hypothetical protein C0392_03290 [Syntrophus sp. (in: bacteria)]|nr:hypothetical protein [Syntrophus sp. (in: bacteria)]
MEAFMSDRKTILLVEDEPLIRLTETRMLEKEGYVVICASSGEKALEITQNGYSIDLILMDIDLGKGMDGAETAREILKDHNIPIMFLSSHTEKEIVEKTAKLSYNYQRMSTYAMTICPLKQRTAGASTLSL